MKLAFVVALFFVYFPSISQQKTAINGFVYSTMGRETMIGVQVFEKKSGVSTTTNEYGYFSISVPVNDTVVLNFYRHGYELKTLSYPVQYKNQLNIYLNEIINLEEVVIENSINNNINNTETGVVNIKVEDIKKLPALFGEFDIIKALQQTPGVQSGGDSKSNFFVRGGASDQNLILLDDVPLYQVSHFGGFFSIFNIDAIHDVKLIKGGFPARFGGRLSSVLDVRLKDGNKERYQGAASVGLFSSRITFEGPIYKKKSSFIVSARRSTPFIFNLSDINYHFYDLNAKLNLEISPKDKIFISFFKGNDGLRIQQNNEIAKNKLISKWGNTLFSFRWNRIYNNKLFGNLTLSGTQYHFNNNFDFNGQNDTAKTVIKSKINTGITDLILKKEFTYSPSSIIKFKFGAQSTYHIFKPNEQSYFYSTNNQIVDEVSNTRIRALENAMFLENHFQIKKMAINVGFRGVSFHVGDKNYYYIEPRLVWNFVLKKDMAIKYSYSIMNQFVHLLSYSGVGYPSDYWMPSTENVSPSKSTQHSLAFVKTFQQNKYELSIESYYKTAQNLIAFKPGQSLVGNLGSWENSIEQNGKGTNYGLEVYLQKLYGKLTGWVSFTYSRAFQQFNNLNNGKIFPFRYDRPIAISIVGIFEINKKCNFSATWNYGTGYPITIASDAYTVDDFDVFVFDELNSFRMRDYHRLDIAFNFPKKLNKSDRNLSLGIFNVYNRLNPYYYFYERDVIFTNNNTTGYEYGEMKLYQRSLFGILPTISYELIF